MWMGRHGIYEVKLRFDHSALLFGFHWGNLRPLGYCCSLLGPTQVLAHELVEALVVFAEEAPQLGHDARVDAWVASALAVPQALVRSVVTQAEEALGAVKVEVVPADARLQPQEALDALQLSHRVLDQLVTVDHQHLAAVKHLHTF